MVRQQFIDFYKNFKPGNKQDENIIKNNKYNSWYGGNWSRCNIWYAVLSE
ncbi:hypothetical protein bcgnr5384_09190 [Bacillus cereus]